MTISRSFSAMAISPRIKSLITILFKVTSKLSKEFFDQNNEVSFPLFSKCLITIHNPQRVDLYKHHKYLYKVDGQKYDVIKGQLALDLRDGKISKLTMEVIDE